MRKRERERRREGEGRERGSGKGGKRETEAAPGKPGQAPIFKGAHHIFLAGKGRQHCTAFAKLFSRAFSASRLKPLEGLRAASVLLSARCGLFQALGAAVFRVVDL